MGSLLIITGPPGAGKSTVSQILAARAPVGVLVEGDAFFGFLATGMIEPWLPESKGQNEIVASAAVAATQAFVVGGYHTIYDGVLGPWSLPLFTAGLDGCADPLDYAILLPPVEVCVERVATRVGHGFDDEAATRKMHHEFTASLSTFLDRHVIDEIGEDHGGGAEAVADAITTAAAGRKLRL